MMLVTQYLDVLKDFAQSGSATMVVPHGPSSVADIESQVRVQFIQGMECDSSSCSCMCSAVLCCAVLCCDLTCHVQYNFVMRCNVRYQHYMIW